MNKQAYGGDDENKRYYNEWDRFDPLYYVNNFPQNDPKAIVEATRRFGEIAKKNNWTATTTPYRYGLSDEPGKEETFFNPIEHAAKLEEHFKTNKLKYLDEKHDDIYPYFYDLKFDKGNVLKERLGLKINQQQKITQ